jgi:nucleoside-diphosphate-sugar epimerase
MPEALLAGGSGFLGRHLTTRLLNRGWEVSHLQFAGRRPYATPSSVQIRQADSVDADSIRKALERTVFDAVFILAAAGVDPANRAPALLLAGNLHLPHAILEALREAPPRCIVQTGSCSEYSPVHQGLALTEDAPTLGSDLYGASKAAGSIWALRLAATYGLPLVLLRLFHVYGSGESQYRLISSLFEQLKQGLPVALSPGEQVRDMLYMEDVLDALEASLRVPPLQIYNLCSSTAVTVAEVARTAARVIGQPESLLQFGALPYRTGELMWLLGDNSRFRQASGWSPRWNLENGMRHMLQVVAEGGTAA